MRMTTMRMMTTHPWETFGPIQQEGWIDSPAGHRQDDNDAPPHPPCPLPGHSHPQRYHKKKKNNEEEHQDPVETTTTTEGRINQIHNVDEQSGRWTMEWKNAVQRMFKKGQT